MPKVLISGNGLDLNLGLPTSFNDFMQVTQSLESISESSTYEDIYALLPNCELIKDIKQPLNLDSNGLEKLREQIIANVWYNHFKNRKEINTWIDFENDIEVALNILNKGFNLIESEINENGSIGTYQGHHNVRTLIGKIEISNYLLEFGVLRGRLNNFKFEEEFIEGKSTRVIKVKVAHFFTKLVTELNRFKDIFAKYIELFITPLYDRIGSLNDVFIFKDEISHHFTFNYTSTLEQIYNINTRHIHGKVSELTSNLVLGLDQIDIGLEYSKHLLPFTKLHQIINNDTDAEFIQSFSEKDNYQFFFFGHSLDKSDGRYIKQVFNFINESPNSEIIIVYHDLESKSNLIANVIDNIGEKIIYNLNSSQRLNFLQLNSKELAKKIKQNIKVKSWGSRLA